MHVYLVYSAVFLLWALFFKPTGIDLGLGFAVMVIVPLATVLITKTNKDTPYILIMTWLQRWMYLFSIAGLASITVEIVWVGTLFSIVWLGATLVIACYGFFRLSLQGFRDAEEVLINVGCIYLAIGGGWFVLSAVQATTFLSYSQTIIDLTAIHFHYSAFVLPIASGMLGRWLKRQSIPLTGFAYLAAGILVGPILVALGIEFGPPLEPVLVLIYIFFVFWLALIAIRFSFVLRGWLRWFLLLAHVVLFMTMVLSYVYSAGLAWAPQRLTIPDMVRFHGMANAFGYALLVLMVWIVVRPSADHTFRMPLQPMRGKKYIQDQLFNHVELKPTNALIKKWREYEHEQFHIEKVNPNVLQFHEQTSRYSLEATIKWQPPFRWLLPILLFVTKQLKQLYLPAGEIPMEGDTYTLVSTDQQHTTVWVRKHAQTKEPIFTAYYSNWLGSKRYNFIQLPLPFGVLTGLLLPLNDEGDGLYLMGDQTDPFTGVYLSFWKWTWKTPLRETFHLVEKEGTLHAKHAISFFRKEMITIKYVMNEDKSPQSGL
ncbi:YndJ family protein [Shouchella lehensis]|uniref:YndJ-like protein n=1 Tax=Shouchella lehensis TaxID=300825 RepID=A0A4Y7WEF2_9BACI|nr:YndJ family protein [Shouchella lehensis]MBG9784821.1 hypothetical protein [Shouchella lehensis]TES46231.1 hypothetical protein E2L03_16105 [Shouchella lehensis]